MVKPVFAVDRRADIAPDDVYDTGSTRMLPRVKALADTLNGRCYV